MFAISRHMSEHPTLVGNLVGISIANLAIDPLEEMLEQPRLPQPLLGADETYPFRWSHSIRGWEASGRWSCRSSAIWTNSAPMSADELKKFIAHMDLLLGRRQAAEAGQEPGAGVARRAEQGRQDASAPHAAVSSSAGFAD